MYTRGVPESETLVPGDKKEPHLCSHVLLSYLFFLTRIYPTEFRLTHFIIKTFTLSQYWYNGHKFNYGLRTQCEYHKALQ